VTPEFALNARLRQVALFLESSVRSSSAIVVAWMGESADLALTSTYSPDAIALSS
jgi:hypothetical protein